MDGLLLVRYSYMETSRPSHGHMFGVTIGACVLFALDHCFTSLPPLIEHHPAKLLLLACSFTYRVKPAKIGRLWSQRRDLAVIHWAITSPRLYAIAAYLASFYWDVR